MTEATRRSFHGLAELVLAGPQHRASGTVRLRVTATGFATVAAPDLRVEADALLAGDRRIALAGRTLGQLATAAGVVPGAPLDVYKTGSGTFPETRMITTAAVPLLAALALGDTALRRFAPTATPVLWPEHFDVGIALDEVNYGVSPGDSGIDEPYAYVGPWHVRANPFWNVPFGAARPIRELAGADALVAFFGEGRRAAT